jgi:hypothetical protein
MLSNNRISKDISKLTELKGEINKFASIMEISALLG